MIRSGNWKPVMLLACADGLVNVTESNETNNCLASATAVTIHPSRDQALAVGRQRRSSA